MADEAGHRPAQHRYAVAGRRQLRDGDAALRLEALRQVGVGVQRDAVRPQLGHLGHGAGYGPGRLLGQAVDQVGIDRLEADAPRRSHQLAHLLDGLDAVHRLPHVSVEVLHAEDQAVEAQRGQVLQARGRGAARDVQVQRQRRPAADGGPGRPLQQGLGVFGRAEGLDEAVRRGVGRVARPGPVQATQHGLGEHGNLIGV